jgi:hypothetical protein
MTQTEVPALPPSKRAGFRHLARIANPYPADVCEMGDEDGCDERPAYWLTAPGSYTIPLMVCAMHAAEESHYFRTSVPK